MSETGDEADVAAPDAFRAFWSYVHEDDADEGGRISELSRLVSRRVRLLTGSAFPIFLDHDGIEWGRRWEMTIEDALETTKFFIPILTPSYFQSMACRSELVKFASAAKNIGLEELILPVYYIDIPEFASEGSAGDELIELVKTFQYEDWREIALDDVGASGHRKGVHRLATALKDRASEADGKPARYLQSSVVSSPEERSAVNADRIRLDGDRPTASGLLAGDYPDDEAPGLIDILADGEGAIFDLTATIDRLPGVMDQLTQAAEKGTERIDRSDRQKKGFAGRLVAAREFAADIEGPAEEINEIAGDFLRDLLRIDPMVRELAVVAKVGSQADEVRPFFESIQTMVAASEEGLGSMENLAQVVVDSTKWSKDMRKPSRRLVEGLRQLADARTIFRSWTPLVDEVLAATPIELVEQGDEELSS